MNPEHLSHRQLKIPEAAPEPLAQLLTRAQDGLTSSSGLDTVRWLHDSLAFLTEFFAAFSIGALKTVGPYSSSLEQLLKTAPSLDRSERLLTQAFVDWRAHPHHPAYESLRDAFFLTSRLQSSRTAPRRHTRWLGVEGRSVEGLEQLSRWSRRLDLLVSGGDDAAASEQIRLYLPVLWIWTDALETFFRDWSLRLKSEVEGGKLKISGTANRDDIHLQLMSTHPIGSLKAQFVVDSAGGVQLDGFSPALNGVAITAPAASLPPESVSTSVAAAEPPLEFAAVAAEPPLPSADPVSAAAQEETATPQAELVFEQPDGAEAVAPQDFGQVQPEASVVVGQFVPLVADPMLPDLGPPSQEEMGVAPAAPRAEVEPELLSPEDLPELPGPGDLPELPGPDDLPELPGPDDLPELPGPDDLPELEPSVPAPNLEEFAIDLSEPQAAEPDLSVFAVDLSTPDDQVAPPEAAPVVEPVPATPELAITPEPAVESVPEPELFSATPEPVVEAAPEPELFAATPEPVAEAVPEPELFAATPEPVAEAVPEPELFAVTPEPVVEAVPEPELFSATPEPVVEAVLEPELFAATPEPVVEAVLEPELFAATPEPVVEAVPEPELFSATPEPVVEAVPEPELFSATPEPAVQAVPEPDLFAATPEPIVEAVSEPDLFAGDSGFGDFVSSSEPLFSGEQSAVGAHEQTVEVAPVPPEPTVEMASVEPPQQPSTPWADLIAASAQNETAETEFDPDEDEPDEAAPMPDFILAAPSREELPDFSDDMSDFGTGFGSFGAGLAGQAGPPESDFGLSAPESGEGLPLSAMPDFSAPAQPVEGFPGFSAPAQPLLEMPDFGVPASQPDQAAPDSGVPASQPDQAAPDPGVPASQPVEAVPDFGATAEPVSGIPNFGLPPSASAPELGTQPVALPDFSAPSVPVAGLPDFSAPTQPSPGLPEFVVPSLPAAEPAATLSGLGGSVEPTPLAPTAPAHQAAAMGSQAEDILEDDFEFSSEAGPSRPQWKGWGVSERENVQGVCETSVGARVGKIPAAFAGPVSQALRSDVNRFQIVLGPGCGKSHLAHDLCATEQHGPFGAVLLVEWPANHSGEVDGQELLSIYFQLREDIKARGTAAVLPEPETVATLAAAVASDGFASAFQRLLGQLAVLNRSGLTLLFDEPPEGIRQNLPANLPGKLRVISFVTAMNSGPELGARVELQAAWPQAAVEIFGPVVSEVASDPAANLLRVGLYVQLRSVGGAPPSSLVDIGQAVLNSPGIDRDLLACLALDQKPVSLDDLDQWYLDSSSVAACVESYPSLFCLRSSRLSPQLGLSHHSIESAVRSQLTEASERAANKLLGWVVAQLERTNADKYGGLQVREIVLRNFCRLYHFATLTGSNEVLEWVARNKDLQRNRVALTTHLEKPASRWELHRLLTLLADTLRTLVATGSCNDLRDELAWALSHLGLNQFHLGLAAEARENLIEALDLFTTLVDKEKQHEFRPALATTLYRASKIADSMGFGQEAREYSERAVSDLIELVEDRGRADLQSRLGIAMALRGSLKNDANDVAGAMKDLQRASSLLASSSEDKQRENKSSQIEVQLELASIFLKARDFDSAVKESGKAVQLATQAVEEQQMEDLQPLLASCHTSRARCYLELNETDRAQRDVSKSITLRNLAVDEGRLDQRFELSKEYLLRAQIDRGRGMTDDAGRDMSRAVEILEQLDNEGRKDAKGQLLVSLVERSDLALSGGDAARSIEDLKKAFAVSQADASGSPEAAFARLSVLDGLLRAYLRAGDSVQALGVSTELLTHYQAAQDWENFARVQLVRGDALERQANLAGANESFNQAIGLLSKLLEQGQTDDRLAMVAEGYLGAGSVDLKMGTSDRAAEHIKRSLDIFSHLFQQRGMKSALPKMLKAYSLFAAVNLNKNKTQDAMVLLKSGFDILAYLEKEGGAANLEAIELRKAELYRQRARALFQQGDLQPALHDTDEAMRNFLLDRQKNQTGPWKDELARTWTLRSSIFFLLKDFTQAESSVQEAIAHFEEQVRAGKFQYFDDLMKALSTRAENAGKAGKIDRVLEEYGRMLGFASAAGQAGTALNVDLESAKILEKRARVYRDQSLFNEAYGDYEKVIGLYRKLLSERGRNDLAIDLVKVHLERGEMISNAGHADHAVGDYSQAVDLAKALLSQGQLEAAPSLARALQKRADCYRAAGKAREALQDLEGAVGFQMQMAQQRQDVELMGSLAGALLSQGTLLAGFQQMPQAAASLDKAIGIFTTLVEQQQQRQFSADMAQALIQRVSLTGDKTDPALRQVLIRAVDLVTAQAREGKPVARDFPIDCLRAVVDLLTREDFDTVGDLIDAVLRLVELVVADGKSNQDFVKLTDLLLAASAGLIDDRRTARRPHFLALACVSCNREIQMFGKNSLPRLVYCLYELGQALERSKPPTVLNYIGSSFALLGELASQQQNNEDFTRELKMMVTTWRSLPPQVPALANVSRHMLSQLLRLT